MTAFGTSYIAGIAFANAASPEVNYQLLLQIVQLLTILFIWMKPV
jgi:hypothetical protein